MVFANAGGGTFLPLGAITETQYQETFDATKAAVRNLARAWARDFATRRIRVNAISRGVVVTPGYKLMG